MSDRLLKLGEVDIIFRYPSGRTKRLVKQGKIPTVTLPDCSLRIKQSIVELLVSKAENRVGFPMVEGRKFF
jgi:hypothetical protein